jgi:Rod binding domain-containing protein
MSIAPTSPALPLSPPNKENREERGTAYRSDSKLANIRTPHLRAPSIDRSKVDPNIVKAADGMETMFMDYLMKVMRETVPKNDMDLENPATEIYRGMLDSEYAKKAVKAGGVGLSDTIIAYLAPQSYNLQKGQMNAPEVPPTNGNRRTGGTP